ncbi:hypothetical protein ACLMJK_005792 [Lecanora helva]
MPVSLSHEPNQATTPLRRLADSLLRAQKEQAPISVPEDALQHVRAYRARGSLHAGRDVEAIVHALESCQSLICTQLDAEGFIILCSILTYSEPYLAQQRGLYLLSEALKTALRQSASQASAAELSSKMIAIGSKALIPLIKGFVNITNHYQTRRWMGILALELLKGCRENVSLLSSNHAVIQSIPSVIEHDQCQVLKLLAGSMVNLLLKLGTSRSLLFPQRKNEAIYSSFPVGDEKDFRWLHAFQGFLAEAQLDNESKLGDNSRLGDDSKLGDDSIQESSGIIFAYGLLLDNTSYNTGEESAILVAISEDLQIVVPQSSNGPALYIDVPLTANSTFNVEGHAIGQSQIPSYVLSMQFSEFFSHTCLLNASTKNYRSFELVFTSEADAKLLGKLLESKNVAKAGTGRLSISEPIAVSQPYSDNPSSSSGAQHATAATPFRQYQDTKSLHTEENDLSGHLVKPNTPPQQDLYTSNHESPNHLPKDPNKGPCDVVQPLSCANGISRPTSVTASNKSDDNQKQPDDFSATKLSRKLQNNDGTIDEPSANAGHESSTDTAPKKGTISKKSSKEKTAISAKTKAGAKKQAKALRKPKPTKLRRKAMTPVPEHIDGEYEIQASSESPKLATVPKQSRQKVITAKKNQNKDVAATPKSRQDRVKATKRNISTDRDAQQIITEHEPGLTNNDPLIRQAQEEDQEQSSRSIERSASQRPQREAASNANARSQSPESSNQITEADSLIEKDFQETAPPTVAISRENHEPKANITQLSRSDGCITTGDTDKEHGGQGLMGAGENVTSAQAPKDPARKSERLQSKKMQNKDQKDETHRDLPAKKCHKKVQSGDPFVTRLGSLIAPVKPSRGSKASDPAKTEVMNVTTSMSDEGQAQVVNLPKPNNRVVKKKEQPPRVRKTEAKKSPEPSTGSKRKVEKDGKRPTKRAKIATQAETSIGTQEQSTNQKISAEPSLLMNKKPELVTWDASGPKNQCVTSSKTPVLAQAITAPPSTPGHKGNGVKRRMPPDYDDQDQQEHDQGAKRQKITPSTPKDNPIIPMAAELTVSEMQKRANRLSSQSTKVDENGSPLPRPKPQIEVRDPDGAPVTISSDADDNLGIVFNDDDTSEADIPDVPQIFRSQEKGVRHVTLTSKGKQYPSSPMARGSFRDAPEHLTLNEEYSSVKNLETGDTITRSEEQDPFVAGGPTNSITIPGSFMEALSRSKKPDARQNNEQVVTRSSGASLKRKSPSDNDEDRSRTLVEADPEPKPKRQKGARKAVSKPSPLSQSTSQDDISPEASLSETHVLDPVTQRLLQEPEEREPIMLDVLTVISHRLVRHLASKELALIELANDYEKEGKDLMKAYKKELGKIKETDQGELGCLKRVMSTIYSDAQDKLRDASKDARKRGAKTRGADQAEIRLKKQDELFRETFNAAANACWID